MPGPFRRWLRMAAPLLLLAALSCRWQLVPRAWRGGAGGNTLKADAAALTSTVVTPHLQAPIAPGRNVLWCATFQLAWNEVCDLIDEPVRLAGDPPMAAILNRRDVTKDCLDSPSYLATAGFIRDGILQRIPRQLTRKFGPGADGRFHPITSKRPQDIIAYAYLLKDLRFATPFEDLDGPLYFGEAPTPVQAFGTYGVKRDRLTHGRMRTQVVVLDYRDPDDLVIELKSSAAGDRLILAKVVPGKTLAATVAAVTERAKADAGDTMQVDDVLAVPKMNFDLTRHYDEVTGRRLLPTNPKVARDVLILQADQHIRFRLDEAGSRLESSSTISIGCSAAPAADRLMIFNKPFLILMQRRDAKAPYFALWVGNSELLVPSPETAAALTPP